MVLSISCANAAVAVDQRSVLAVYCYIHHAVELYVFLCAVLDGKSDRVWILHVAALVLFASALSNVSNLLPLRHGDLQVEDIFVYLSVLRSISRNKVPI